MKTTKYSWILDSGITLVLGWWLIGTALAHSAAVGYAITKSISLGKPDTWDLLEFDSSSGRVYVTHSSEVDVFDGTTGNEIGRVAGLRDVHAVVTVPALGKGYVTEGGGDAVAEFDLASLKVQRRIPTEHGPDALLYDSFTGRLFAMNGRSASVTVIDAKTGATVSRIPLGGDPEAGVSDGKGDVYVNIANRSEVVRISAAGGTLNARWPMPGCKTPHGMSIDIQTARLFVTCSNSEMVVLDTTSGREVTSLPIGMLSDGCVFDPARKWIYSSDGFGSLSIVREAGADSFAAVAKIPTKPTARTMALNSHTGRVYLIASELDFHPEGRELWQRYTIRPGTVQLLFADPK